MSNNRDEILTKDIIRYLRQLSKLHGDDVIGNAKMGKALLMLSVHLQKYSSYPISKAINLIEKKSIIKDKISKKPNKKYIQLNYSVLTKDQIKDYLETGILTKQQLIDLGNIKFGIPKSGMLRMNREDLIDRIKSALAHMDSIAIISDAAKDGGKDRKT